jgi:AGZA family xanthine/uracil permease-like MFS transporter
MSKNHYKWARVGDVNAFFGLMLDNIAGLVLMVGLLAGVFSFPVDFALKYMVPGTAIGVLVGDLLYTWLAFAHSKKTGNPKVTAMPLGLDTPSTIGMVFFVLGPSFAIRLGELAVAAGWEIEKLREAATPGSEASQILAQINFEAATHAWHIGICAIFFSGLIKFAMAFCSNWLRNAMPRAGLLGSLAAIALVLITFSPLEKVSENPLVGFTSLIIVFISLVARGRLPWRIPGALGAVLAGCAVWYVMLGLNAAGFEIVSAHSDSTDTYWFPTEWMTVFTFQWGAAIGDSVVYLPYIFPFAIATVIGGIDCTESAASAGDDFNTNTIIGIEAFATLVASLCGGVIQSTPYIGHPAYKAMGGRAAYTLATALFVGGAGLIGYFGLLFSIIPEAAVMPILIFIGIEITAQSFHVTPKRHYAALAVACLPALAKLIVIYLGQYLSPEVMDSNEKILNLRILAGGFIITSLIWSSAMARIIDRRFVSASIYMAAGGIMVLFGVMHSPMNDQMFWPTQIMSFEPEVKSAIIEYAIAYLVMSGILFGYGILMTDKIRVITTDDEFDAISD